MKKGREGTSKNSWKFCLVQPPSFLSSQRPNAAGRPALFKSYCPPQDVEHQRRIVLWRASHCKKDSHINIGRLSEGTPRNCCAHMWTLKVCLAIFSNYFQFYYFSPDNTHQPSCLLLDSSMHLVVEQEVNQELDTLVTLSAHLL